MLTDALQSLIVLWVFVFALCFVWGVVAFVRWLAGKALDGIEQVRQERERAVREAWYRSHTRRVL